jgi:signal transduction histidine kinase
MLQGMEGLIRRVHHAADVVRRLRILAGGERPQRVAADLCEVVRRALDVLQGPLDECHAAVKLDFARDFPAVKIDSVQIVQVVVNLLRNAIEAMCNIPAPRRQLTVRAQFDSREAIVAVEDQGVGLSVDAIQRLFQPLASTKATGMGLGLALCRQIVEAHGGRIWAKGNVPSGCVFSFTVPLEPEEP